MGQRTKHKIFSGSSWIKITNSYLRPFTLNVIIDKVGLKGIMLLFVYYSFFFSLMSLFGWVIFDGSVLVFTIGL